MGLDSSTSILNYFTGRSSATTGDFYCIHTQQNDSTSRLASHKDSKNYSIASNTIRIFASRTNRGVREIATGSRRSTLECVTGV